MERTNCILLVATCLLFSCTTVKDDTNPCLTDDDSYLKLIEEVYTQKDVNAYHKLVIMSMKQKIGLFEASDYLANSINYPYANFMLFIHFTKSEVNNAYSIEHLSYIDKCYALDKLNKAYLAKEDNSVNAVDFYFSLNQDYFIKSKNEIVLNPKYIPPAVRSVRKKR